MTAAHGQSELPGLGAYCDPRHHHQRGERFGRLFADLPGLYVDPASLDALGAPDGPMKGAPPTQADTVPVGFVFFGQFLDHDITLDLTSSLDSVTEDPELIGNARTPTLDLDCVYGVGPEAQPYLYHSSGTFKGAKLVTGAEVGDGTHSSEDLARANGVALIGDFRNDENRIVSQIQLGMIRFHNRICQQLHDDDGLEGAHLYEEARRVVTWHYQWAVVRDFLTTICGEGVVNRILGAGRRFYRPKEAYIPVEFSVAAYRFGHSMVPMTVQVQKGDDRLELFGATLGGGFDAVPDARAVCDMHELFETFEGRDVQRAGGLDSTMAADLLRLPVNVDGQRRSLATRNLLRGQGFMLPSGEVVADFMGRPEAEVDQVHDACVADEAGLVAGTPLWFYILKEAELIGRENADGTREPGEGLGPVGATIVAETIIGLIEKDGRSWLANDRSWRPWHRSDDEDVELSTIGHVLTYT